MAKFEDAIDYVLANEGGLTIDPGDPGGVTNFGIAQKFHPEVNVRALDRAGAKEIYRAEYWRFDGIASQRVATKIFDIYVNMSPSSAVRIVQLALGRIEAGPVIADGKWGPQTEGALNAIQDESAFLAELCAQLSKHYCDLAQARPEQAHDLLGWLRRAAQLPN